MTSQVFPPEEFARRRARLAAQIGSDAWALVEGAGPVDGFTVFRQTNEFYYLTGLETPQARLLIGGGAATLYLPPGDAHATAEGGTPGADDIEAVKALTGVDAVRPLSCLASDLPDAGVLYTPHSPAEGRLACQDTLRHAAQAIAADPWDGTLPREERLLQRLHALRPEVEALDLTPLLDGMRLVKSAREIAVMRRTGALCARAVVEAMRSTRPGVTEYQLGAVADYVFRVNGARSEGYRPIIASGANIWYPHYYRNDGLLRDGDLVLMDYAPDLHYYTNDIGRMWPVSGRYSPVQRLLYGLMVEYHKALLARIRPGVLPQTVLNEAAEAMAPLVDATDFPKAAYKEAARRTLTFKGHLSHPVGMAVHDVGRYFDRPLEPGLVFAVDPQMWVPEERLYVRVEDTVVVTEDGVEVLTTGAPLELDDVEALMTGPGLLQQFPMREEDPDDSPRA